SESAAYARIEAARTARRFPQILALLADASITLTTVVVLAPVLDARNHVEVLARARHKSKREVQEIVAQLRPAPAVCSSVRKLPAVLRPVRAVAPPVPGTGGGLSGLQNVSEGTPPDGAAPVVAHPPAVVPLAPERYKVQFTVNAETHAKLRR